MDIVETGLISFVAFILIGGTMAYVAGPPPDLGRIGSDVAQERAGPCLEKTGSCQPQPKASQGPADASPRGDLERDDDDEDDDDRDPDEGKRRKKGKD